jgi:Ca-activated chloride channel family protein
VLPPGASRLHVLNLLQRMRTAAARSKPAQRHRAGRPAARRPTASCAPLAGVRGVGLHQRPGWEDALARLARRHEVVAVRLFDPLEMELPDVGLVTVEDAETGEQLLSTPATRPSANATPPSRSSRKRRCCAAWRVRRRHAGTGHRRRPARRAAALCRPAPAARAAEGAGALPAHCSTRAPDSRRGMSFPVWPDLLWLLLLLPLLVLLYLWLLKRGASAHGAPGQRASWPGRMGKGPGWRRHVPPLLMLLALAPCCWPRRGRWRDHAAAGASAPSCWRWTCRAACAPRTSSPTAGGLAGGGQGLRQAGLPREVRVGVVSFAGTAAVVQAPTTSRDDVVAAIDRFQLQRATATGSGIILSLATLFPDHGIDLIQHVTGQRNFPGKPIGRGTGQGQAEVHAGGPAATTSAAIIMLTDGQRTTGPDPMDAAKMAAERGVRVYTVGIGTTSGEIIGFEGWSMRVRLDEETLKNISVPRAGEYFYAGTAEDLKKVYESLGAALVVERKETEVSALFAALGALLAMVSAGLSVWWFGRVA